MAIRFRAGRNAPWIVYWKNPFTGKTEEAAYTTEPEAKKANSLLKHRLKYERESFRPESETSKEAEPDSLEGCYYLYLREKKFSKKSLIWSLDAMRPILPVIGHLPISEIQREHLEQVKKVLMESGVKPVTVRGRMSVLRTVLRWCAEQGIIEHCPQFPKLPPAHYEHFIPPTTSELAALLAVSPAHLVRVILLGAQLGVRVGPSELLKLTWADIDFDNAVARVQAAKKRPQQPWREVPIRASLLTQMEEWAREDSLAGIEHIVHYRGKPIKSIQTSWANALKAAGITRRIRPYDLRHAFGTEAIAAGVDVGTVAQLMGHDPKMLLEHYQHVADKQKRVAVEALPDIQNYGKKLRQEKTQKNKAP